MSNCKNNKKEYLKKLKSFQDTTNMNLSDDSPDEKPSTIFRPSFRCPECCLIPIIILKENESKVKINCINGHNNVMGLNEFMERCVQKNISNIECSECGTQLEPKKRFKYCSQCDKIFCKICLKKHNANHITTNHETISLRKMDTFCCLHKNRYTYFCEICHKNICENCFYLHNNHQILSLKEIKLSKNEVKELRENLCKENDIIGEIEVIFKNCINSIKKKFEDVINHKRQVLELKKLIDDIYEVKDSNFQIIDTVNRLKFNTEHINIEKDMNELDILFELFSYLNCIDYNICLTSSLLNLDNSNQGSNMTQEESSFNNKYKERICINNTYDNSFNKDEKEKHIGKKYIYEKKNKQIFDSIIFETEEEKNNDSLKNIYQNLNLDNKVENINDKMNNTNIENKNEIYKNTINNNDEVDSNKNKKYAKKIMKGKINQKKIIQNNNITNSTIKEESKDFSKYIAKIEHNRFLSDSKIPNTSNSFIKINKNNSLIEDLIQYDNNTYRNDKCPDLLNYEKDKNNNKSDNSMDENLNINQEFNNNNNELANSKKKIKKKSKTKDKSKDKSKKKVLKVKSKEKKDKSMDKIIDKFNNKVKDKSKEKRVKIKRDDNYEDNNVGQLSHSFDNAINNYNEHYNSFEYTYQFKNQIKINLDSNSKLERSFFSEMPDKSIQTPRDYNLNGISNNKNKNNLKLIKLVNKNFYNDEKELYNNLNSEKKSINKDLHLIPPIMIETKKDTENTKEININSNLSKIIGTKSDKINNIFYEISDDNVSKDDTCDMNISKDIIDNNNISQDNYLSNDDVSIDNNKDKKNKKKKKKIIKKKKKIKKVINIEENPLNELIKEIKIVKTNKEQSEIKNEKNNLNSERTSNSRNKTKNIFNEIYECQNTDQTKKGTISSKKEASSSLLKDNSLIIQEKLKSPKPFNTMDDINLIQNKQITPSHSRTQSKQSQTNVEKKDIDNVSTKKLKKIKVIKKKKKKIDLSKSFDDVSKMVKPVDITPNKKNNNINNINNNKTIQRSNSFDIINHLPELETTHKINSMKFENGINCLLEISKNIFGAGNLIGDIKIIEKYSYKEKQTIKEHNGTINSLFKLHDGAILSSSADRLMKKIRLTNNNTSYNIEFVFDGYENYIFKGIELKNHKIISCSWDNKLYLWEGKNNKYINTLKFNEDQRVEDIMEISNNSFCSIAESDLKIWNSNNMALLHSIKLQRGIITPNSLCKVNDKILMAISFNAIHLFDLVNFNLINSILMDQGNLSCITKLNDGSILISEDINTDHYCIFYLKQYILEGDELQYISYKKDKFYKSNKNNDKEVRALIQFSEGIIAQGITGEFNGKDCGDIYFYE